MHYVYGVPLDKPFPNALDLISGTPEKPAPYGYVPMFVSKKPGSAFGYSGGGFIVLQHLLELREKEPIAAIMGKFLAQAGAGVALGLSFHHELPGKHYANGYTDAGGMVPGGRLNFPPLAAGALGTAAALADWLRQLAVAYQRPEGCGCVTHAAARSVLANRPDIGSEAFMRSRMVRAHARTPS